MGAVKRLTRAAFRDAVFRRDGYRCAVCWLAKCPLDPHHITDRSAMPNGGYVPENGIALCPVCHGRAEGRVRGYRPADLYAKIGSSLEKATAAAARGL